MIWHSEDINAVKNELGTDFETGLSSADIAEKIQKYGENKITEEGSKPLFARLKKRFASAPTIVLMIFSTVVLLVGIIKGDDSWYLPVIFPIIVAANGLISAFLEKKAEGGLISLKSRVTLKAKVKRDGEVSVVDVNTIVPGDIVLLSEGDFVPADGRLIESAALICDESALTGDTDPSEKAADFIPEDICPIEERKNMVYYGCSVTFGSGLMLVTETGMETELARKEVITEQIVGKESPLKHKLREVSRLLSLATLSVSVIIFILGLLYGSNSNMLFSDLVFNTLVLSSAFAVTAMPDSVLGTLIFALGFGTEKMSHKQAIIKNTEAALTLGYTSVIISDKTGTLTKNKMKATYLYDGSRMLNLGKEQPDKTFLALISTAALCCNSRVVLSAGGRKRCLGDPTEGAIVEACLDYCGLSKEDIENISPRMEAIPFDSERKLMTTINMINNRPFAIVKGSADILLDCCSSGNIKGAKEALEEMGRLGLRVIGVAIKPLSEIPSNPSSEDIERDLSVLGLFGIEDVITEETRQMIKACDSAGIKTVMITGDYITSAIAMGKQIGLMGEDSLAITGEELSKMGDDELQNKIRHISVYSRVTPEQKLRILETFKEQGETVTVTGDSALDSTFLRQADVGCAMGKAGTDISKGSADLVLNEDSYISIGSSIKHSRGIIKNIRKAVNLSLVAFFAEAISMILGFLIFGRPIISAAGLIFTNLIVLFMPLVALLAEPAGSELMLEGPKNPKINILADKLTISVLWQGGLITLLTLIAFGIGKATSPAVASGFALATLCVTLIALAFNVRGEVSLFKTGFITNPLMLISVGISLLAVILVIFTPISSFFSGGLGGDKILL